MMITLRLYFLNHLAESLSEFLDDLTLQGLNGCSRIGQPVLDEELVHKVGVFHDFLAKFGVRSQSFLAVIIVRSVLDPLLCVSDELSLEWAVCFDANKEIVLIHVHFKKKNFNLLWIHSHF
jgi:hypothetical protein